MSYDFLQGKSILVTGGTGSFGKKFVKTLLEKTQVARAVVFSRDELKQSQMAAELNNWSNRLRFFIGDVRDLERLELAFREVDYVVHAAALKQVPTLEYNPFEAIKTNIIGTQNVISAALNRKVKKVLLISTDKAANPANLYGATKLCAERLIISSNAYSWEGNAIFSAVRYGNVLGSRGSLVEVIEEQKKSGEVNLTHEEMTRFWITIDKGIELVLMALEKMQGGEIFVPKIPSMKVADFIKIIAGDCKIKVIGMRPGEKIHEVLITQEEARHSIEFVEHYVILPEQDRWQEKVDFKEGKKLVEGFNFSSDKNEKWLAEEDIKKMLLEF